jgi:hypothetical protein
MKVNGCKVEENTKIINKRTINILFNKYHQIYVDNQ